MTGEERTFRHRLARLLAEIARNPRPPEPPRARPDREAERAQ